ncbi:unnamed protein product (macronuclear) [Paramecium tetraurelia]|uniref:Uncharacterized protein n=1 Tax=Paramecium tetraurelia TaxID=5888 RepID=A0DQY7_PARTE|nr:uncharacterized protein GSPATT00002855001 [Paramecium tetraurelia]CAK85454.1 unnamed protein product [Paramecium tetraurelia]|eukprot:XP_001452851.1 hypothetical protein (macronuclear) [Paramecium tetraurelia strain d4-2]
MNRQFSVSKDMGNFSMQSPDKQIYCPKTQSQAKIQQYGPSPYMQSPQFDAKQVSQNNVIIQPSPPQKLENSYQYKPSIKNGSINDIFKPHNQQEVIKSQNEIKPHYETYKYEYNKTFAGTFQSDANREQITDRKSNTSKKDGTSLIDSKENYQQFQAKSLLTDNHPTVGNSRLSSQNINLIQSKPKLQTEIFRISGALRELMSSIQKMMGDGRLPDQINDKMIEILANFRKLEEIANNEPVDSDSKISSMAEDYNKLKNILEQLQTKMTALVQENQKLNKNLFEQEQKVTEEIKKKQLAEDKANQANKEFNRVFECLQINQKENEELKNKLIQSESFKNLSCQTSNRVQNDEINNYKMKNQQLQNELEQLEVKYKQLLTEKNNQKEIPKSPLIIKSIHSSTSKQSEQLELKLLQLQIENDNLKAEMAHNQVDSKVIDSKNDMIQKLEEKIKSILKEKSISEEQSIQICHNLEIMNEQLKNSLQNKEIDLSNLSKQKNELEREYRNQINNLNSILKGTEDKVQMAKQDYQKLLDEFKQIDLRKGKLQEDLRNTEKKLDSLNQELAFTRGELKKSTDRNHQLQTQYDQMNQQLQQQTSLQQQLLQQIDGLKQNELQVRMEYEKLEKQMQAVKSEMKYQVTELNEMISLQARKTQEKERQLNELIEEMGGMRDQYEVQKKVCQENVNDLERRLKNLRLQQEELLQVKEQEILDLKQTMDQQIKMLDKRNVLSSFDYDQREQQLQAELLSKNDQIEALKSEVEKVRSNNFNVQEELLRQGMLLNQHQATIANYKNELSQSRQEQQHLSEMLKKRKEETDQLHQNLEEMRKELQSKKISDDSRRSALRQQDLQIALENLSRENLSLQQKVNGLSNEMNRKSRELSERNEEYQILKRKYDETVANLERLEKRWGEKIDLHRKN